MRGVTIAFSKNFPLHDPVRFKDPNGRFIFVKGILDETPLMFASIYSPNSNQISFLRDPLQALENFRAGELLIGGGLIIVGNPVLDRTSTKKKESNKQPQIKTPSTFYSILQALTRSILGVLFTFQQNNTPITLLLIKLTPILTISYVQSPFLNIVNQLKLALKQLRTLPG